MEGLFKRGLLYERTNVVEWLVPGREDALAPPDGYIVSFVLFHERGLAVPPHPFFQGLLHHYQIELQHLNPNGIQHIMAVIAMCEGYLGIELHFKLWRYFFSISLIKKKERGRETPVSMGCACIHLRGSGWPSTCPASSLDPTRGGTRIGST